MNRFDFEAIWKIQGCGDSATQPGTVGMLSANCCTSQNCRNWSPSAKRSLQNMGLNMPLLYSPAGWASLATACKSHNMVQFYTSDATPDNKSQELWSMAKRKPQTNKTEKNARVLTSVYFLSYHSLKLLSNSIKKKTKYKYSSRHLLRTVSYSQLNFNALFHKRNIC